MSTTITFTKAQKAAAILVALGKQRASKLLKQFKKEEIRILVDAAHSLTAIEQPDLEKLVQEFENDYARGTGLLDSSEQMDAIINETWTAEEMRAFHDDGGDVDEMSSAEIWELLEEADPAHVATFLQTENPQVGALLVTSLSAAKSATVIAALDRETRTAVLSRAMSMRAPAPAAVDMILRRMGKEFRRSGASDEKSNQIRVAGILNELDKSVSEEALDDLTTTVGNDRAEAVRAMLFRFDDIPRLELTSRSMVFDQISSEMLTLALRNTPPEVVSATLESIGQRTRRMIESDLGRPAVGVKPKDIDTAQRSIVATIQRLSREGLITMTSAKELAA